MIGARTAGRAAALRAARRLLLIVFAAWLIFPPFAHAQNDGHPQSPDLSDKSLEDLMNTEVTSVSKKTQKLSQTAAAIFVITQEDIRRSSATNIPDLLRMVPGLDVAEMNGSTWAISARGFNAQYSNKLLVMIDGRIVYTPNFAGVYWDTLDLPLEEIDRIEVIRGPGGSVWGANAVNGVISIFTKKAADTQGGTLVAGGGTVDQGFGMAQWGAKVGTKTDYRVFAKYFNQDHLLDLTGQTGADGWHVLRGGFRADSALSSKDSLTIEGNLYTGREGELGFILPAVTSPTLVAIPEEINLGGGFLQGTWNHSYSSQSNSTLQAAFTRYRRDDPLEPERRNTFDLDYEHQFAWGQRQQIVWGLGYRYTTDHIGGSFTVSFHPPSRALNLFNGFVQDEIALVPDRVRLTLGTKLEHNDYTGLEFMPSARIAWTPDAQQMLWGAVSRALRAPSRNDTNLLVNIGSFTDQSGTLTLSRFLGNPDFKDERLIAYELGYRASVAERLSVDLAAYFDDYDNLQTVEPFTSFFEPSPPPPHEVTTLTYENLMHGETHGVEIAANWKATNRWTLSPGYALELLHMHLAPTSEDTISPAFVEHGAPRHSVQLRSHFDLGRGLTWDTSVNFVDRLSHQGMTFDQVMPAYTRVDTGLKWTPWDAVTISIAGQNLVKDHHPEFEDFFPSLQSGQVKRSGYAQISWRF